MQQKTVRCSKNFVRMEQKLFALKSQNCFREAKKPRFCFIVAKNGSKQNRANLAGDLIGDVGAIFFVLLKHHSKFFSVK
jgi:hypothetical protein